MKTKLDPETVSPNTRVIITNKKKEIIIGVIITTHKVNPQRAIGFIEICIKGHDEIMFVSVVHIIPGTEIYRYSSELMTLLLLENYHDISDKIHKRPKYE